MELGAFSVSLAVKDLETSRRFYEKLGMISEADESSAGLASFMIADPDGNTILVDQHV